VEVVVVHTYQNRQSQSAPVGASFPITWILKNSGTCDWPAGTQLVYQSGEQFGDREIVSFDSLPAPGGEITVQATNFRAPNATGNYESVWQLIDAEGEPVGEPIVFSIQLYVPATATPTRPPATPTPAVTPTAAAAVNAHVEVDYNSCEYAGDQWRCLLIIVPYGGGGGPYVIWVDDTSPPAHYNQVTTRALHWMQRRRCFDWVQTITVRDEATATQTSFQRFYSSNDMFTGGCTLP
jgi:hypothetical protein